MKTFEDESGATWDVVAGRESWGGLLALFIPRNRGGTGVRQAPLRASDYQQALSELHELDENELRRLLEASEPRSP